MVKIATLGPSVRLVVFQFHVKNESVPANVPKYSDFHKPTTIQFEGTGVRIMEPTTDVLPDFVSKSDYRLIDAWQAPEETEVWNRSVVQFVFCHKEHLNLAGLRPEFIAGRDGLLDSFSRLTTKNLWKTMLHSNPFFVAGKSTDERVLVLDCNSRKSTVKLVPVETGEYEFVPVSIDDEEIFVKQPITVMTEEPVMVFQGGRERAEKGVFRPGIGPKILLTDKANRLNLVGNDIVLVFPKPAIPVSTSPAVTS